MYKEDVKEETDEDPIMFGEIELKRAQCVTYLGDELHEDGPIYCQPCLTTFEPPHENWS